MDIEDFESEYVHISELDKLKDSESLVKELIYHLYKSGSVDDIENIADELAGFWNIEVPAMEPKISRRL